MYWYKQTLGHLPQQVAAQMKFQETSSLLGERMSAKMVGSNYDLNIQNITSSDEGIYFCATGTQYRMEFKSGTFVTVRGMYTIVVYKQYFMRRLCCIHDFFIVNIQVTIFRDLTTRQCCSSQSLSQSIQETL